MKNYHFNIRLCPGRCVNVINVAQSLAHGFPGFLEHGSANINVTIGG